MTTNELSIELSTTQRAVLAYAIEHSEGKLVWFPENLRGGARKKVLDGLAKRGLITCDGADWHVAAGGHAALGCVAPVPAPQVAGPEIEAAVATAEATWTQERKGQQPRIRENTKQARVIAMLQRPEGATVQQICADTGWQAHTVRGAFAGAFKKKLGLAIVSDKNDSGERVYRIAQE